MPDAPALTLDEHLAKAYDYYVHGRRGRPIAWSPDIFADALQADADMAAAAKNKLIALSGVMRVRGEKSCVVTKTQARALTEALAKSRAPQ